MGHLGQGHELRDPGRRQEADGAGAVGGQVPVQGIARLLLPAVGMFPVAGEQAPVAHPGCLVPLVVVPLGSAMVADIARQPAGQDLAPVN